MSLLFLLPLFGLQLLGTYRLAKSHDANDDYAKKSTIGNVTCLSAVNWMTGLSLIWELQQLVPVAW